MSFTTFFKDKILYFILLLFVVITSEILLLSADIIMYIRIYIGLLPIILFFVAIFVEYYKKNKYYSNLNDRLEELNEKYLMLEDYKEYIELWIHEIKIPIATSKMIIENNKTKVTESINEELDKIENYTEQALYYARSNTVEKDYLIKKVNLKEIVNNSILKNKVSLIQNKVNVNIYDVERNVYTDSKWCIFILNQIIQNSIKYSKKNDKKLDIFSVEKKEKVVLYIKDNGIGIKKGEITKVFDKGFTGENGRIIEKKSTGIGLYLSKKLCDKIGIGLELNSEKDIGTEVRMIFPKNSFLNY